MQVKSITECYKGKQCAILSTSIRLSFVIQTFVLSIFESSLKTGLFVEYIIPDALPSAGSVVVPYRINCHSDNVKTKNNQDNNINEINIFIFVRFNH